MFLMVTTTSSIGGGFWEYVRSWAPVVLSSISTVFTAITVVVALNTLKKNRRDLRRRDEPYLVVLPDFPTFDLTWEVFTNGRDRRITAEARASNGLRLALKLQNLGEGAAFGTKIVISLSETLPDRVMGFWGHTGDPAVDGVTGNLNYGAVDRGRLRGQANHGGDGDFYRDVAHRMEIDAPANFGFSKEAGQVEVPDEILASLLMYALRCEATNWQEDERAPPMPEVPSFPLLTIQARCVDRHNRTHPAPDVTFALKFERGRFVQKGGTEVPFPVPAEWPPEGKRNWHRLTQTVRLVRTA